MLGTPLFRDSTETVRGCQGVIDWDCTKKLDGILDRKTMTKMNGKNGYAFPPPDQGLTGRRWADDLVGKGYEKCQ